MKKRYDPDGCIASAEKRTFPGSSGPGTGYLIFEEGVFDFRIPREGVNRKCREATRSSRPAYDENVGVFQFPGKSICDTIPSRKYRDGGCTGEP
jgi:hypothetical protein